MPARDTKLDSDDLHLEMARRLHGAPGEDAFVVISQLVLDMYDKVHNAYLGHVEIPSSGWDTAHRTKNMREVSDELHELATSWGWVSSEPRSCGEIAAMHANEINLFSINSRQRLLSVGMGWRVERDGSYSMLATPYAKGALWTDVREGDLADFVIGWTQELGWVFRSKDRPGDDNYHMSKLLMLLVAAHGGGAAVAGVSPNLRELLEAVAA